MSNSLSQQKIRNVAIIAHVDHGKTTLVDAFLKQGNLFRDNQEEMNQSQILDSGELEREKGITITAKNTSIHYGEYKINIIDTPGHSDFGGEVERTLNMADGCILLVDAQEGPRPQTKFVLKKALEMGLRPMLVINKIDKKFANPKKILDKASDLFLSLATKPEQLDFPVFYAIGREGKVFTKLPEGDITAPNSIEGNVKPLLDAIVDFVPAPKGDPDGDFQMQVSSLEYNQHLGRYLIGKIARGTVKLNDPIALAISPDDKDKPLKGNVRKLMVREGLQFVDVNEASTGEIVAIAGIDSTAIGGTICNPKNIDPLPVIKISEPSVKVKFEANTSPFVGKEGKYVTMKLLQQRLDREIETNISLKITKSDTGSYYVAGRGELQLSILIETLRREGYELQVRKPEVIFKEINGEKYEPLEELYVDVPEEYMGPASAALSARNATIEDIENENGQARFSCKILTRNLLGLRSVLLDATKGNVILNNYVFDYVPFTEQKEIFRNGVLVSSHTGTAMGYSLNTVQERGDLFVEPGLEVYEGMILGINKYEQDIEVNPTKGRHQSAVRMKHDEITQTKLKPVIPLTLEFALSFINDDEILEVTPKHLRLRKQYLTKNERTWAKRDNLTDYAQKQMGLK